MARTLTPATPSGKSRTSGPVRKVFGTLAAIGTALAAGVWLLELVPLEFSWVFPIPQLVAFDVWFGLLALICCALAAVARRRTVALVALICALLQLGGYLGYWTGVRNEQGPAPQEASVRVMTLNCYFGQADAQIVADTVREGGVQVLCLQETTSELTDALYDHGLGDVLPYWVGSVTGDQIWSAFPLQNEVVDAVGYSGCAMPAATAQIGDERLRFVSIHTCAPMPGLEGYWFESLGRIASLRGFDAGLEPQDRYVLMGDFNAMRGHRAFANILDRGFTDGVRAAGEGMVFTWPIDKGPFALVALDHILLDRGLDLRNVAYIDVAGTDHRGVLATVLP